MPGREGGKAKPLKAPRKDKKELDDVRSALVPSPCRLRGPELMFGMASHKGRPGVH